MPRLISTLPLVALLSLGTALHAQEETGGNAAAETATEEQPAAETATDQGTAAEDAEGTADDGEETTDEGEEEAGSDDEALDMGRQQQDPTYIKEQYGDWQLKCFRSEAEEDPCQMYQLLTEEAGNPVAEFSLFRLAEGAQAVAGATIVVPLGTLLTEELRISVDGGRAKTYTYSFCSMVGCFARIGLTQEDINSFKAGGVANLQIVPAQAPDQTVNIRASLDGFTAAFDNVTVVQN
ncbi:Invasion protein IalB, involved in pathogenesis [Roseovarius pacificus]|uniref:Invasion protein IalB, involved in pathogenesis n=1 Tax=Roseovarius pacificus TaxID=337701 RepID=A0A1M6WP01_9RHOB|nr:invasion associated locus B family protein [Roseovarius pacificus]GGO53093.1 hypothetical protein GCM10011315_10180 [Roseovarius pacificus]SHK95411.1 Invasion protein IalB, involved in pathogenesis [Roseovarius pacificus]